MGTRVTRPSETGPEGLNLRSSEGSLMSTHQPSRRGVALIRRCAPTRGAPNLNPVMDRVTEFEYNPQNLREEWEYGRSEVGMEWACRRFVARRHR